MQNFTIRSLLKTVLLIFCLSLWQLPAIAAPETPAGQMIVVSGQVTAAQPSQAPRALTRGSVFYSGDTITTGPAGSAQLRFTDGTVIALKPGSVFRINEYAFDISNGKEGVHVGALKYVVSLLAGGLRSISGAIAKYNPSDYNLSTTVATIGVRGTDYSLAYNAGSKDCALAAALTAGKIIVKNAAGEIVLGQDEQYRYACIESQYIAPKGENTMPPGFSYVYPKALPGSHRAGGICLQ